MKNKILFPLLLLPFGNLLTSVGCSNTSTRNYDELVNEIKTVALEEFNEICKHPHPTYNLHEIFEYLKQRIQNLGYQPQTDNYDTARQYGNIWFDIPATAGCESWKKIIIQGHMDMVYAGPDSTKQIIPVVETIIDPVTQTSQKIMHSEQYKTSLGADDGIGIATMLAIAQNKNIKHGPIRFLMTADEEQNRDGASALPANVLDSNYLINVDGEIDCGLAIACYGTCACTFEKDFNFSNTTLSNQFKIRALNFHGGHSGEDVGFKYGNAERFLWEVLDKLIENNYQVELNLVDHKNKDQEDCEYQANALIPNAGIAFATSANKAAVDSAIAYTKTLWQNKYSGEDWSKIELANDVISTKFTKSISINDSNNLIKLFGDRENGLPCGLFNILDEEKKVPGASSNIGATTLDVNKGSDPTTHFTSHSLGRSYLTKDIKVFHNDAQPSQETNVKKSFYNIWNSIFNDSGSGITKYTRDFAWESKDVNPIRDIAIEGYRKIAKKEPTIVSMYGVLEESIFIEKNPNLNMITIGPKILNCHTQHETLYLDSVDDEYKSLFYLIENIWQIN